MITLHHFLLIGFFFLLLTGCAKKGPQLSNKDLIYADAMVDVYVASGAANLIHIGDKDSMRQILIVKGLELHDLDTNEFYSYVSHLEKDPRKLNVFYDTVMARMTIRNKE